jgi:hypothetical protein
MTDSPWNQAFSAASEVAYSGEQEESMADL